MCNIPSLTGKAIIYALKKAEFTGARIRGIHYVLTNSDGRITFVPVHSGETIGKGLLAQILRDCELTINDLIQLL
ncbi:MAG TPA: type II toxin-antitoxin system HicA family toxin [Allocoleopsis sp.]